MDENNPEAGLHAEFVYIADPGYQDLMETLSAITNYTTFVEFHGYQASAVKSFTEELGDCSKHSLHADVTVGRSDSLVFSCAVDFSGYKTDVKDRVFRYTNTYETATGKYLSLSRMVTDMDALFTAITEVADKLAGSEVIFKDNAWKDTFKKRIAGETAPWLAVDEGLEFYLNAENYPSLAVDSVTLLVRVEDYPQLFAPEWIGSYDGSVPRKTPDYAQLYTNPCRAAISTLAKGIKTMTWKEATEVLKAAGIPFEGLDEKEASEQESDAYINFTDPTTNQAYSLSFWPFEDGDVQRLESIRFRGAVNLYIDNAYGLYDTRYVMVDPWIYDDFEEVTAVSFSSTDEMIALSAVTLPSYHNDN